MFIFVDHYGINPARCRVAPTHEYSNKAKNLLQLQCVGGGGVERRRGAKLLVWLNTEDLESATLI